MNKLSVGLFLALTGAVALSSSAAMRVVDGTNGDDVNDGAIVDHGGGVLVTNAVRTISRALAKVEKNDTVVILPGTYCEPSVLTNSKDSITFRGATGKPEDVIIGGGGTHRIFYSSKAGVVLESLTFQDGYRPAFQSAADAAYAGDREGGGAIRFGGSDRSVANTISNCVFRNNETAYYDNTPSKVSGAGGGAICSSRPLMIFDSVFSNNAAVAKGSGGGGAVHMYGAATVSPRIERCLFTGNSCSMQGGGGALVIESASMEPAILRDCTFIGNSTCRSDPTLTGNTNDKSNPRAMGGAVCGLFELIDGCVFVSNSTDMATNPASDGKTYYAHGGALYLLNTASLTRPVRILNTVFRGNDSAFGACGAIGLNVEASGTPKTSHTPYVISNCVFEANTSYGECPAFGSATGSQGLMSIEFLDCQFVDNRTTGGITSPIYMSVDRSVAPVNIYAYTAHVARCTFRGNVTPHVCSALSLANRSNNGSNYGGAVIEDCVFDGNFCNRKKVTSSGCGALYLSELDTNVVVRNCLFCRNESNRSVGGSFWADTSPADGLVRIVENCTFVDNVAYAHASSTSYFCYGAPYLKFQGGDPERCAIRNCIIAGNWATNEYGTVKVRNVNPDVKPASTNNLYGAVESGVLVEADYTMADGENGCKTGCDPRFVDAEQGDYRLKRTSPARDCGAESPWMRAPGAHDLQVTNEFGKISSRIYGPTVDIGCYEWRSYGLMILLR